MLWCRGCGEGWGQEPDGQKLATGAPVWAESALPLQWGLLWVLPGQKAVTGCSGGSEGAAMKYKSRFPDCSHDRRPGLPRATGVTAGLAPRLRGQFRGSHSSVTLTHNVSSEEEGPLLIEFSQKNSKSQGNKIIEYTWHLGL